MLQNYEKNKPFQWYKDDILATEIGSKDEVNNIILTDYVMINVYR